MEMERKGVKEEEKRENRKRKVLVSKKKLVDPKKVSFE
jgi:hypothetical protein